MITVDDATTLDAETCAAHPMAADLNWLLHRVASGLASALDQVVRRHGASVRGYLVLTAIATCPPTTQLALGEQLGVDKTAMTAVLDQLEAQTWIERRPSPNDRRARLAVVTSAGRTWLAQLQPELEDAEAALLSDLSADEIAELRTTLRRLALGRFASAAPPGGSCV